MRNTTPVKSCPCGSNKTYLECCERFISQQNKPATPEELMRSRYTAYTQANMDYIVATMKSPAADGFDANTAYEWAKQTKWLGLEIKQTKLEGSQGIVEFIAHFLLNNKKSTLHEVSEFILEDGQWYYVNGMERQDEITDKIGRNDPCPCGSGKKYKKCCA